MSLLALTVPDRFCPSSGRQGEKGDTVASRGPGDGFTGKMLDI
jgi:hypothetical protein